MQSEPTLTRTSTELRLRTVCMTLGRPCTVRILEHIPIPSDCNEEYLPLADPPPSSSPVSTFFVENTKAAMLLGKILDRVYHPSQNPDMSSEPQSPQSLRPEVLSAILSLHVELQEFASSSLKALRRHGDGGSGAIILKRQRNVFHSRSGLRILGISAY